MMKTRSKAIVLLLAVVVLSAAACQVYSPITRIYSLESVTSERVGTADDVKINLTTYTPSGRARGTALLLPDLYTNRLSFDLDPEHSLARYLASRGWVVVVAEWRGTGLSDKPDWANKEIYTWTIGQMLSNDMTAAVAHAQAQGPGPLVVWAHGHAGVLATAMMQRDAGHGIDALVGLGVPGRHYDISAIFKALDEQSGRLDPFSGVDCRLAATNRAPFQGHEETIADVILLNDKLLEADVKERFTTKGLEVQSVQVAATVLSWWRDEDLVIDVDGENWNVTRNLDRVTVPAYLACGKLDNWVTPGETITLLDGLGSGRKTMRVFSQANGCDDNYGHMGLLLGPNAQTEVWDPILRWLDDIDL